MAFALGLITSALQTVFVMLSWILTTYLGRRTIYVWGSAINCGFLFILGIAASVGVSRSASFAQASLGLIISVLFTLGPAPASWVIIGETSSIRLRPLTTGIGRGCYYIVNIPCIFLSSYMLNPDVSEISNPGTLQLHFADSSAGCKPWWQVRIRLGRHSFRLLCPGMVVCSGDEGPFLPRDRYSVQAQGSGAQVEEDHCRRRGRRVSERFYWGQWVLQEHILDWLESLVLLCRLYIVWRIVEGIGTMPMLSKFEPRSIAEQSVPIANPESEQQSSFS